MGEMEIDELMRLVAAANAGRWGGGDAGREAGDAERALAARFRTRETLAVYGTLAPGEPNHHVVAPLGGTWADGVVEGDLRAAGWGAAMGYPAFRPRPGGPAVPVKVLTSPALPSAWTELDRFEGAEYRRILIPVLRADDTRTLLTIANLYADAGDDAPR
jgi:gamma-glutamylcyclotransferase (GGCT)/AIG2-like uncharacterized protein YtfP